MKKKWLTFLVITLTLTLNCQSQKIERSKGTLDVTSLVVAEESSFLPFKISDDQIEEIKRWWGVTRLSLKNYSLDLKTVIKIPQSVTYKAITVDKNEKTTLDFINYLKDPQANAALQSKSVFICGPHLSTILKRSGILANLEYTKIIGPLVVSGKQEVIVEYVIKGESVSKVLNLVRNLLLRDESFKVRKFAPNELLWYWSIVSWDIEEPLLMFENNYHKVGINFDKNGKVFFLDLFENLEW